MLGSLAGATWPKVGAVALFFIVSLLLGKTISRGLDLFALGEADARFAGVDVEVVKRLSTILIAAAVGAAVSVSGVIGFVGIVVPHILRLLIGPGHRLLLPASVLAGAILLALADCLARTVVAPAELPVGIVTALVGAPFFLWLLLKQRVLGAS
jgi:iron complex transport system permease protein